MYTIAELEILRVVRQRAADAELPRVGLVYQAILPPLIDSSTSKSSIDTIKTNNLLNQQDSIDTNTSSRRSKKSTGTQAQVKKDEKKLTIFTGSNVPGNNKDLKDKLLSNLKNASFQVHHSHKFDNSEIRTNIDSFLEEFGVGSSRRRLVTKSRTGPGVEILLAVLSGCKNNIKIARHAISPCMAWAETSQDENRQHVWKNLIAAAIDTSIISSSLPIEITIQSILTYIKQTWPNAWTQISFKDDDSLIENTKTEILNNRKKNENGKISIDTNTNSFVNSEVAHVEDLVSEVHVSDTILSQTQNNIVVDSYNNLTNTTLPTPTSLTDPPISISTSSTTETDSQKTELVVLDNNLVTKFATNSFSKQVSPTSATTFTSNSITTTINTLISPSKEVVTSMYVSLVLEAAYMFSFITETFSNVYTQISSSNTINESNATSPISSSTTNSYIQTISSSTTLASSLASILFSEFPIPVPPSVATILRGKETPWTDEETQGFMTGLTRHGRVFSNVALCVPTRCPAQCIAYYYGPWRRTPFFASFRSPRGRDAADKQKRLEKEMLRRDRAWFHFWRFDDDACGPSLPPAAIPVPSTMNILGAEEASIQSENLPLLVPAIDVIVTKDGNVFEAPPTTKTIANNASTNTTVPAVTTRAASRIEGMYQIPNTSGDLQTTMPLVAISYPIGGNETFFFGSPVGISTTSTMQKNQMPKPELIHDLLESIAADPLVDYKRVLDASHSALNKAFGEIVDERDNLNQHNSLSTEEVTQPTTPPISTTDALAETIKPLHSTTQAHLFSSDWLSERFIDNESYCGHCGDGGDLVCCEGPCRRSFHKECLGSRDIGVRAAVKASPTLLASRNLSGLENLDRDDWRCASCILGSSECFICGESGQEGVDLRRCVRMCGKSYHLACVRASPRTVFLNTAPGAEPRFSCPFHKCGTCLQPFDAMRPPIYKRCHACPSAYHVPCVPPGSFYDMVDTITCPNTKAHAAKKVSPMYRSRSGLLRNGVAPAAGLTLDRSMLEQLAGRSGRNRIVGDSFMRRVEEALDAAEKKGNAVDGVQKVNEANIDKKGKRSRTSLEGDVQDSTVTNSNVKPSPPKQISKNVVGLLPIRGTKQRSTYFGVAASTPHGLGRKTRWCARLSEGNKIRHIGTYDTELEAAIAFDIAAHSLGRQVNFAWDESKNMPDTSKRLGMKSPVFSIGRPKEKFKNSTSDTQEADWKLPADELLDMNEEISDNN